VKTSKTIYIKRSFFVVFLLLCSLLNEASAQNWSDNLMKYWYYRDRLEYFVMPGTKPGQSLVAGLRNNPWENSRDAISFGQPYIRMGFYLGVLATEYKLLLKNGQFEEADNVLPEIDLALNALIRTDMHESGNPWHFLGFYNDYWDGFFVREDVPPLFNMLYNAEGYLNHFNKNLKENENIVTLLHQGYYGKPSKISYNKIDCISARFNAQESQYFNYGGTFNLTQFYNHDSTWINSYKHRNFTSQDETIGVLVGLALVYKLVDNTIINQKAKQIADKLISFVHNHPICFNINWNMKFPDCTYLGMDNGGNASFYAYGLSKTRNLFNLSTYYMTNPLVIAWDGAVDGAIISNDISHKHMTTQLLCLSNYMGNYSASLKIKNITNDENWDTFYLLLHSVLHNADPNTFYNLNKLKDQINAAPCGGTFSYSNYIEQLSDVNYPGTQGWASENKFTHSKQEQNNGQFFFPGTFHGLDFMLLYNLASLSFPSEFPYFVNYRNRKITDNFPMLTPFILNNYIGSNSNPVILRAINSLKSNSFIQSDGNVTFIAGEQIDLLPGFDSQEGSEFLSKIESYNCNGLPYKNSKLVPWSNEGLISQYDSIISIPYDRRPSPIYTPDDYFENDSGISISDDGFNPITELDTVQISVFPNPANDYIRVEIDMKQKAKVIVYISDNKGIEKYSEIKNLEIGKQIFNIDLNSIDSGNYLLILQGERTYASCSFLKL